MAIIYICNNCPWKPKPGSVIKCDNINTGPFYCPGCGEKLTVVDTEKPHNQPLHEEPQKDAAL